MTIGVVTGLPAEATLIAGSPAACRGPGHARASAAAAALIETGVTALVSFGTAGGLDPALPPGTVVLADTVVSADGRRFPTDAAWRAAVLARCADLTSRVAALADAADPVSTVAAKADLRARTGAVAVDMESAAVAAAAQAADLPFLVVRVIADGAERALPAAALAGLDADGVIRPLGSVLALLRRPWELPALLRLAADSRRAFATLATVGGRVGA